MELSDVISISTRVNLHSLNLLLFSISKGEKIGINGVTPGMNFSLYVCCGDGNLCLNISE